jgi:hypothetical protein
MKDALEKAKSSIGGASGLAKALGGITPQAISQWSRVPAERVLDVERVTGISRYELRPDIYPSEENPFRPSLSSDPPPQTAPIPLATEAEEVRAAE